MRFLGLPPWERHRNGLHPVTNPARYGWGSSSLPVRPHPKYATHVLMFLLTVVTTLIAGMLWEGIDPLNHPEQFYRGLPYTGTLLGILFCHEMGHYLTARYYGMDVTLPFFIPAPPPLFILGTFGAVIRMQSPPQHRRALLHVGAAGPIAGFVVALPAIIYAYRTASQVHLSTAASDTSIAFGVPLLLEFISYWTVGPLPDGVSLTLNSVGVAAWFGLLVTVFNLLPIGQLDGGHIVYALIGPRARYVSLVMIGALGALGIVWPGWWLWAVLGWLTARKQPIVLDQQDPLNWRSQLLAALALVIFVVCFIPVPMRIGGF